MTYTTTFITSTEIAVSFQAEGWHCWPQAPQRRAYLRQSHRHMFHVYAALQVLHDERDVEFHDLRDACVQWFGSGDYGSMSCEALARQLCEQIVTTWPGRTARVVVSEDDENAAMVSIEQTEE